MSSGFGGGSQGQIRYQLIIDDAQANQKIGTFKNSLTQLAPATANVNREMGALANNFKGTTGGLTQQNTLIGQMTAQHKSLGTQIKDTSARFSTLAIGISATASSALSLAAGFRDYNDAQIAVERVTRKLSLAHEALTKAQDKLNGLQAKGIKSGKAYEQAQLDVQQAQQAVDIQTQLLGESQERLFDSQTQFVVSIVPTVIGAFGTLGAAIKSFSGPDGVSGATGALGGLKTAISGMGGMSKFLMFAGPIGLAVTAAALLISKLEELKKTASDAFHEFGFKTIDTSFLQDAKKAVDELNASFNDTNEILKKTGPKSVLDLNLHAKESLQTFKDLGGAVDKTGHAVQTLTDRNIELQPAFKKNGETAATWIHWMEVYLEKSRGMDDTMARLKKAGFDDATATKISAAAHEDYNNKIKVGEPLLKATTKATNDTTVAQKTLGVQLVFNTSQWANTSAEVEDVTASYKDLLDPTKTLAGQLLKNQQATQGVNGQYKETTHLLSELNPVQRENVRLFNDAFMITRKVTEQQNLYSQSLINSIKNMETTNDQVIQQETSWSTLGDTLINDLKFMDQMDKANVQQAKSLSDAATAWENFANKFNASRVDLTKALDIKLPEVDKLTKKLVDMLPSSLEKNMKQGLKKSGFASTFAEAFNNMISGAIKANPLKPGQFSWTDWMNIDNDKEADKFGKSIMQMIDKAFGGHKNVPQKWRDFEAAIAEAIGSGATQSELPKILGKMVEDAPPIKVIVIADPAHPLPADAQKQLDKAGPLTVKIAADFGNVSAQVEKGQDPGVSYTPTKNDVDKLLSSKSLSKMKKMELLYRLGYRMGFRPDSAMLGYRGTGNPYLGGLYMPELYGAGPKFDYGPNAYGTEDLGNKRDQTKLLKNVGAFMMLSQGGINNKNQTFSNSDPGSLWGFLGGGGAALANANPLDILARQLVQITKNLSTFARAIVQVTKDNNLFARTITTITADNNQLARTVVTITADNNQLARTTAQLVKNNNVYAKTVVQVTADHNQLARTIATMVKDNNQFAKTQVQLTKNNNTYAQTVVQVTKDHNQLAKTQVQLTKNNNTLARTIVQVGKDFSKAAGDAKDFAKALIAVAAAAKKARSATGGSSTGGGTEMAQHGMHKTLAQDTMILAHKGERVDIGPGSGGDGTGVSGGGANGTIVVNLTNVNSDRETTRVFRRKLGENQFRFGPR